MEIKKIVEDYIQNDNANGAILINGDWGIGKSHYLRETLVPVIQNITNITTTKTYECLYVSLNGISDTNQILFQLALAKLPWAKSKSAKKAFSIGTVV